MNNILWKKKATEPEVQLSERDARVLDTYTRRMKKFDEMIKVCCCWVGYDVLLGNYERGYVCIARLWLKSYL